MKILQDQVLGPWERVRRFHFDLSYGTISSPAWSKAPLIKELMHWKGAQQVYLKTLVTAG